MTTSAIVAPRLAAAVHCSALMAATLTLACSTRDPSSSPSSLGGSSVSTVPAMVTRPYPQLSQRVSRYATHARMDEQRARQASCSVVAQSWPAATAFAVVWRITSAYCMTAAMPLSRTDVRGVPCRRCHIQAPVWPC